MSIRTIIEVNHDYINQLVERGHISEQLRDAIFSERTLEVYSVELQGIRRLAQRHHSDEIIIEVK